jgi:hypothetical protein
MNHDKIEAVSPQRVFLQADNWQDKTIYEGEGCTWCQDRINKDDVEYIRLDLHESDLSSLRQENQRFGELVENCTKTCDELRQENEKLKGLQSEIFEHAPDLEKDGPQELWGHLVTWDEIIKHCNTAWDRPQGYSQSPLELITQIIDERDDSRKENELLRSKLGKIEEALRKISNSGYDDNSANPYEWASTIARVSLELTGEQKG